MSEEGKPATSAREMYLDPLIATARLVGRFFDVATLMIRLLFNTMVYDSPSGKRELPGGGAAGTPRT